MSASLSHRARAHKSGDHPPRAGHARRERQLSPKPIATLSLPGPARQPSSCTRRPCRLILPHAARLPRAPAAVDHLAGACRVQPSSSRLHLSYCHRRSVAAATRPRRCRSSFSSRTRSSTATRSSNSIAAPSSGARAPGRAAMPSASLEFAPASRRSARAGHPRASKSPPLHYSSLAQDHAEKSHHSC
jgi:hypothetical protein